MVQVLFSCSAERDVVINRIARVALNIAVARLSQLESGVRNGDQIVNHAGIGLRFDWRIAERKAAVGGGRRPHYAIFRADEHTFRAHAQCDFAVVITITLVCAGNDFGNRAQRRVDLLVISIKILHQHAVGLRPLVQLIIFCIIQIKNSLL